MLISRLQQIKSACITFPFSSKTHSCRLKYEAAFVFFYLKSMTHCSKYHYRFGLSATVIAGKLYVLYIINAVWLRSFSLWSRGRGRQRLRRFCIFKPRAVTRLSTWMQKCLCFQKQQIQKSLSHDFTHQLRYELLWSRRQVHCKHVIPEEFKAQIRID